MDLSKLEVAGLTVAERRPCILLVDDDEVLCLILARELRRKGFDVYSSGCGSEAVELYCRFKGQIDLVLMDVNMPRMTGPAALQAMRACDSDVRCCFVTADEAFDSHDAITSQGALAVFRKPFHTVAELAVALRQITKSPNRETQPAVLEACEWKN